MQLRTDLALEAVAMAGETLGEADRTLSEQQRAGITVTRLTVKSERAAAVYDKPCGEYVTLSLPPLSDDEKKLLEAATLAAEEIRRFLPKAGTVLTVGLGNRAITPDALGPRTADMVLATRHIQGEFARSVGLSDLRPSAVVVPGVLGQTGTESGELVRGVCGVVRPAAVIAVDALAARSVARLGCTVQVSDTGIAPGAGVGNHRLPLCAQTLGVPVIAVGVPTVVDAATVAADCGADAETVERIAPAARRLVVTPREIDLLIGRAARLVAAAINAALQPDYAPLELISLALDS